MLRTIFMQIHPSSWKRLLPKTTIFSQTKRRFSQQLLKTLFVWKTENICFPYEKKSRLLSKTFPTAENYFPLVGNSSQELRTTKDFFPFKLFLSAKSLCHKKKSKQLKKTLSTYGEISAAKKTFFQRIQSLQLRQLYSWEAPFFSKKIFLSYWNFRERERETLTFSQKTTLRSWKTLISRQKKKIQQNIWAP